MMSTSKGAWGQSVHQAHEARTGRELGATDTVVDVDERVVDRPALRGREGTGVLDLPCDRPVT
jgi:hypothetical protein